MSSAAEYLVEDAESLPETDQKAASDYLIAFAVFIWALIQNGWGISKLEFFRHTEADRTLIAWEIVERGQFIVPHLLGTEILTKPPLYYWFSALSIYLFDSATVGVARSVSLVAAAVTVSAHYIFMRRFGYGQQKSLLSTVLLGASVAFFVLAPVAEIDMLFGCFCTLSLYFLFGAETFPSFRWTLAAYFFAGLAFLTKGPQIVFFFAATLICFKAMRYVQYPEERDCIGALIFRHIVGVLLFLAVVGIWLVPLIAQVGWAAIVEQFRIEVLDRVTSYSARERGAFFYPRALFIALLPWSAIAIPGWLYAIKNHKRLRGSDFTNFALISVLTAMMLLSVAQGKSSRYIFPIHVLAMHLVFVGILWLRTTDLRVHILRILAGLSAVMVIGLPIAIPFIDLPGITISQTATAAFVLSVSFAIVGTFAYRDKLASTLLAMALVMFTMRIAQHLVYTPHRNETRSIQKLAERIDSKIPAGETLYTVELFERWINYYLKLQGRNSERLSPQNIPLVEATKPKAYLLLSADDESWRLAQLRFYDPELQILAQDQEEQAHVLLISVKTSALKHLNPRGIFPTEATVPFLDQIRMADPTSGN